MLAVRDHLLSSACSLLACDATAVVGRLNHALSDLVHLGLADYVWLTVFDDGIARVIHSANCPALTSELQELVHRRSAAYIENMPPK